MVKCPQCGAGLQRAHRLGFQRIFYTHLYHCGSCGTEVNEMRLGLRSTLTFVFSRHTRCIKCGTTDVQRRKKKDSVEPMSGHPLSRLLFLTAAPIYRCPTCRIQYYDWRTRA
jgi:uncharacterized protein with PIN domain